MPPLSVLPNRFTGSVPASGRGSPYLTHGLEHFPPHLQQLAPGLGVHLAFARQSCPSCPSAPLTRPSVRPGLHRAHGTHPWPIMPCPSWTAALMTRPAPHCTHLGVGAPRGAAKQEHRQQPDRQCRHRCSPSHPPSSSFAALQVRHVYAGARHAGHASCPHDSAPCVTTPLRAFAKGSLRSRRRVSQESSPRTLCRPGDPFAKAQNKDYRVTNTNEQERTERGGGFGIFTTGVGTYAGDSMKRAAVLCGPAALGGTSTGAHKDAQTRSHITPMPAQCQKANATGPERIHTPSTTVAIRSCKRLPIRWSPRHTPA